MTNNSETPRPTREQLAREYTAGASIRTLAAKYSTSYGWTHSQLIASETPLRKRGGTNRINPR